MSGVTIRVRSDTSQARRELQKLEGAVTNISNRANQVTKVFAGIGTAIAVAFAGDALTKASDSFINLENKIALVVGRTRELDKTVSALYDVATVTRTSINATTETFNRFGKALKGVDAKALIGVTQTVQQALTISGGSAQAAEAAIFQLGQGLASGTLRGQELNSVLEQAPRIATAIADSLNVSVGELRALAEQGKLTTDVVFGALEGQAEAIAKEFQLVNGTVAQGLQSVKQQFERVFGLFDKSTLAVGALGLVLSNIAEYINKNATTIALKSAYIFNILSNTFRGFIEIGKGVFSIFGAVIGRIADALPRIIVPMRTLNDDIFAGLIYSITTATTKFFKLIGFTDAWIESFLGIGLEGTIFRIFNASSLIEFGLALQDLGDSIGTLGKRYYNVFNKAEAIVRNLNYEFLTLGIYLGAVDQKLLAFRYTSFERFSKVLKPIGSALGDIALAIAGMDIVSLAITGIVVTLQGAFQVIDSVFNLFGVSIRRSLGQLGKFDKALEEINPFDRRNTVDFFENFGKGFDTRIVKGFVKGTYIAENAWGKLIDSINETSVFDTVQERIRKFVKAVERGFFFLYDEIIANSWWTDLMIGIYEKAKTYLSLTTDYIKKFFNNVTSVFSSFSAKNFLLNVKVRLTDGSIIKDAKRIGGNIKSLLTSSLKDASNTIAEIYSKITSSLPSLGKLFSVAITSAILAIAWPSALFKLGGLLGLGFASYLGSGLTEVLGGAIARSGFFSDLGSAVGSAVGKIGNFLITNLPLILQGLLDFARAFGKALIEELTGAFAVIPQLLSSVSGGVFDTIFGAAAAATTFSLLFRGFEKTVKDFSKLGGKSGILSSIFLGQGRAVASILAAITLINSAIGGFTEGGAFAETLLSGGLLAYAILGPRGVTALKDKVLGAVSDIAKTGFSVFEKKSGKAVDYFGLIGFKDRLKSGNFSAALQTASYSLQQLKSDLESKSRPSFVKGFNKDLSSISAKLEGTFAGNILADFTRYGSKAGGSFAKGFQNNKKLLGIGAILAAGLLSAGAANAATASVESQTNKVIDSLLDNALGIANAGIMALAIFGPNSLKSAAGSLIGAAANVGVSVISTLAKINIATLAAGGTGKLGVIGKFLFGAAGRLNKFAIAKALFSVVKTIATTFASGLLAVLPSLIGVLLNPAAWIAGGVAILSLIFFGEGDNFIDKTLNFFSKIRSLITGTSLEARNLGRELKKVLPSDKVGDIEINLKAQLEGINLERVDNRDFRNVVTSLKSLNAISEEAQATFDEKGEMSILEQQRIQRAVRDVENAVYATRTNSGDDPILGPVIQRLAPSALLDESSGIFGFFKTSIINDTDRTAALVEIGAKIEEGAASTKEQAQYALDLLKIFRQEGVDGAQQEIARDLFESLRPLLERQVRGETVSASKNQLELFQEALKGIDLTGTIPILSLGATSELQRLVYAIEAQTEIGNRRLELEERFKALSSVTQVANSSVAGGANPLPDLDIEQYAALTETARDELDIAVARVNETLKNAALSAIEDAFREGSATGSLFLEKIKRNSGVTFTDLVNPEGGVEAFSQFYEDILAAGVDAQNIPNLFEFVDNDELGNRLAVASSLFEENSNNIERRSSLLSERVSKAINDLPSDLNFSDDLLGAIDTTQLTDAIVADLESSSRTLNAFYKNLEISEEARLLNVSATSSKISDIILGLVSETDQLRLALSLADGDTIEEKDLYKFDQSTRDKILGFVADIILLQTTLSNLELGGVNEAESATFEETVAKLAAQRKALLGIVKAPDTSKGSKGDKKTVFEEFVGSLSDSGFALDIERAASLSRKAINSLKAPLSQIEKAQKAIVNSALGDSKARQASLVAIRAQKLEILAILTQGSVAQANEAYSAFGLDPEQVGKSAQAETIGRRILDLQLQLNDASNLDYETKSNITRELEYQQGLLANITSDSMAASDNIRSAFAESFKSLLKGESSIKGFFTSLLDSISENIIDTVVDSFTQAFFRASNLDTMFDTFFSKLMGSASSVGDSAGIEVKTGIEAGLEGMEDGGLLSGLSAGFTSILGSLGKGLSSIFEGLSGMFSGGGGFLSSILGAFSGAPLHTGGIVQMRSAGGLINPNIGQAGKDSVPVMLTPGEYVLPSQRAAELLKSNSANNSSNQTVVNLSVNGDISRQTRKEIIKMLPSIAQGVNAQNKENNYRR